MTTLETNPIAFFFSPLSSTPDRFWSWGVLAAAGPVGTAVLSI